MLEVLRYVHSNGGIRRAALKVLHMTRTESNYRIMPHLKGYLDYVLRAASDLYRGGEGGHLRGPMPFLASK